MPENPLIPTDLVQSFAETARRLYVSEDLDETLGRITAAAVETVPACEVASISLLGDDGSVATRAPTDPLAAKVDAIQYETGEGPCLDAAGTERLVYAPDTTVDARWPTFSMRSNQELGVASLLSCRLEVVSGSPATLGALNLYAPGRDAFSQADMLMTILLASNAAVVTHAALTHASLLKAIETRDVIGQAKGILMARQGLTSDEAFDILRKASQRTNRKLRDLAAEIATRQKNDAVGPVV